jgi:hypothetical protein
MPKFDCQYRTDSPNGQLALQQVQKLSVGDTLKSEFIPSISAPVKWVLTEAVENRWKLDGSFYDIPLYTVTIEVREGRIGMRVEEPA